MGVEVESAPVHPVWGTFRSVRDRLFDQFVDVPFRPDTGTAELGAEVDGWLAANAHLPRALQKAHAFRIVCERGRICVDPLDWFAGHVDHGWLVTRLRDGWQEEARRGPLSDEAEWSDRCFDLGLMRGGLDVYHIAPGWENAFAGGLAAPACEADELRPALSDPGDDRGAFYEAVSVVCRASIALSERLADLCERRAEERPEHAERLRAVAVACRRVPGGSPRTFHEALQFVWFLHEMLQIEGEPPFSLGHLDRMLYPYYEADLDAGRLTRDQARELLEFFWIKFHARMRGQGDSARNFLLGGQKRDGTDATNELTYVALEAFEELAAPDPKLSVRFFAGTPDRLYRRAAELLQGGHNAMVLMNDEPIVPSLVKRGKTLEDARSYLPIGCYEPAVDGKDAACTMNLPINLAKLLELALHNGVDPVSGERLGARTGNALQFASFGDLWDAYVAQMEFVIARSVRNIRAHERQWPSINPSPLMAATIDDCLARGLDVGQGGARYNSVGAIGVALANAADSLLALKQAVFDERRFSMAQIIEATDADFAGQEPMRQYLLNGVPKWGSGDPDADAMGRRIADHWCSTIHSHRSERGGPFQAALFALRFQWLWGKVTGALPDGRKAGTPLAPGVGATPGRDSRGVTGLMNSVTGLDSTEMPDGSVLDVMLHPSAVRGPEGLNAVVALIKSFFARGGYALQFNVVDAETLRDAQRRPERYANLQIRVSGYCAYFTALPKYEQDLFIARNTHVL